VLEQLACLALAAVPWAPVAAEGAHPACSGCHAPGGAFTSGAAACVDCHQVAGPSLGGPHSDCLTCHDPHASGARLLRTHTEGDRPAVDASLDPVSRSCAACHADEADWQGTMGRYQRHPVSLPAGRICASAGPGLPLVDVRATPEPEDDVVACTTCHDVHGTSRSSLLRWETGQQVEACRGCHTAGGTSCAAGELVARGGRRP